MVNRACGVLFLAATTLAAAAEGDAYFSSMFVALTSTTSRWTQEQWNRDVQSMHDVGMSFVIIPHTGRQISDPSVACPQGKFELFYPVPSSANDVDCYVQKGDLTSEGGTLGNIFRAAKAAGMKDGVHLGLNFYPAEHGWPYGENETNSFAGWGEFQANTAVRLYDMFSSTGLLRGFYTEIEFWNNNGWIQRFEAFGRYYQGAVARKIAQLEDGQSIQVWASPYSIGNLTRYPKSRHDATPEEYGKRFKALFENAGSGFHHVAMQDSMGAQGNSFQNASEFLGNISANVRTWANVELFEVWPPTCQWPSKCHGRHPANFSTRIVKQMENEANALGGVDKATLIAWEWYSCFSPNAIGDPNHPWPLEAKANYDAYKHHLSSIRVVLA